MPIPVTAEEIRLDDRLCLALYMASRAMTANYRKSLSALGLTYPQYLVMVLLWEEGSCSVGQIGGRLSLESSTLSPLLKRLEAIGLLTRARSAEDERLVTVALAPKGRALEHRAKDLPAQICAAAGLSLAEQAVLVEQLRELAARLDVAASTSPSARRS